MAHARKKFAIKPAATPNSEINVTPLVDVVLVLLIIFMVVTPLLEKDIEVRVPDAEQVEDMSDVPPDQLVVSLDKDNTLRINADVIPEPEYVKKLERVLAAKAHGERLVFFMADDKASYAKLVGALDGAKQAGAEILGMMTEKVGADAIPGSAPGTPPAPDAPPAPEAPPATPP